MMTVTVMRTTFHLSPAGNMFIVYRDNVLCILTIPAISVIMVVRDGDTR